MINSLRPALLPHQDLSRMIVVGVGCGLLGAMFTLVAKPVPGPVALPPPSVMVPAEEFVDVAETTAPNETQAASEQFLFVFDAGGNKYLKLADLDRPDQIRWLPKLELVPKLTNEDRLRYPNVLGLYRVDPQGSLVPVAERISGIRALRLVDVDGDGNLEIFGRADLEALLEQPDGTEIQIMRDRFFGD